VRAIYVLIRSSGLTRKRHRQARPAMTVGTENGEVFGCFVAAPLECIGSVNLRTFDPRWLIGSPRLPRRGRIAG